MRATLTLSVRKESKYCRMEFKPALVRGSLSTPQWVGTLLLVRAKRSRPRLYSAHNSLYQLQALSRGLPFLLLLSSGTVS